MDSNLRTVTVEIEIEKEVLDEIEKSHTGEHKELTIKNEILRHEIRKSNDTINKLNRDKDFERLNGYSGKFFKRWYDMSESATSVEYFAIFGVVEDESNFEFNGICLSGWQMAISDRVETYYVEVDGHHKVVEIKKEEFMIKWEESRAALEKINTTLVTNNDR